MDLFIKYDCVVCYATIEWVYREDEGLLPAGLRGCPGGCQMVHDLSIREITEEREEHAQMILDRYPLFDRGDQC